MAECFCGCGRKVKFLDRNLNKQARYTAATTERLRQAVQEVEEHGPYAEGGDNDGVVGVLNEMADNGDAFRAFWESIIHGEPPENENRPMLNMPPSLAFLSFPPSPAEARAARQEWTGWRKGAEIYSGLFELPPAEMESAIRELEDAIREAEEEP